VAAYKSLPKRERDMLEKAKVDVIATDQLVGEAGSPAEYEHADAKRRIVVAMKGRLEVGGQVLMSENNDVNGSFKHEAGHALYDVLGLADWKEFQTSFNKEKDKLPHDVREQLQHLMEAPTEAFAELYASIRGRDTKRTRLMREHFPETLKLVEHKMG